MSHSDFDAQKLRYEDLVEILAKPTLPHEAPVSDVFATVMSYFLTSGAQPTKEAPISDALQTRKPFKK